MTVEVVRNQDDHAVVRTACRNCDTPLSLPCQLENGEWVEPTKSALNLGRLLVCSKCAEADVLERAERDSKQGVAERIKGARIPNAFRGLRFEDMDRSGVREKAVAAAWGWAEADEGGVLLYGPPGTGKTRLAATAIWARLQRRPAVWCSVAHLIASLQAAFSDQDRKDALRILTGDGALVLDDLDKVRPSEQVLSQLFVAIDRRIGAGAPLFVTSNAPPGALTERFGSAITSRLLGYCMVVELGGTDRRLSRGERA